MEATETLTPHQQTIYEIVKEYLNKNPSFTLIELCRIVKKQTHLPESEIQVVLSKLIKKKIIVDGSKLTKEMVLKNPVRAKLYHFIAKNPAINFTQLLKKFNLGSYAARLHLEILRKFGYIRQKKIKIYNVYFSTGFPENKEALVYSLRNQNALRIYLCLKYTPLNSNNLAQILNLNYSTIQYHIKELLQKRLIILNENNKFAVNPDFLDSIHQFYELTVPQKLRNLCDNLSGMKRKTLPPSDLEFREQIANQSDSLTTQLKQLQETILDQQSLTQTIEKIETRLLTIEEEMKNFTETLSKLKNPDE